MDAGRIPNSAAAYKNQLTASLTVGKNKSYLGEPANPQGGNWRRGRPPKHLLFRMRLGDLLEGGFMLSAIF
jgi:hypothetical protein